MLRDQLMELSELLAEEEYRTAAWLAGKMSVSEKTVRTRLKELRSVLQKNGADIISKARYGYRLEVSDRSRLKHLLQASVRSEPKIPETSQERNQYLLAYLLNQNHYVRMDDLCEFLFVSKTTLGHSVKNVEYILNRYQIRLDRKPNYGIKIQGRELDIRRLLSDYFVKRNNLEGLNWDHQQLAMANLAKAVKELLGKYEIYLTEVSFENFLDYLYVAQKRISRGNYLEMETESHVLIGVKEQAFVKALIQMMEQQAGLCYTKDEEAYLLVYLAGKRIIGNVVENDSNFIIQEKTDRLALQMIAEIQKEYHMDFRNNFDVRMALNQHLVPFDIRIRYDIPLTNPLLEEVKTKYSLAYEMSYRASRVLQIHYQKEISEDEIGYFAFIFALALERGKGQEHDRSDILIVCSTGRGSSRLLKYKYEHEFSDYLRNIYVCDWSSLEHFDFTKIDYVFTTVPVTTEVPVPILEVGQFLGNNDIRKVTDLLRRGNQGCLMQYYQPKRFLTDLAGTTKEEVLSSLCQVIAEQEEVDDDFLELVLERESYAQMDYGNYISIPHPNRIASFQTFAYVAVLKEPVIWNRNPVQVILLTSVGRESEDNTRQKFYEATARFALDREAILALIDHPDYDTLMHLLQS